MNYIEIVSTGILALGCIILAMLLRDHKATVLQYAAQLVQSAEQAIQGSGMGAAKKALVLAQLEAAGIHINTWLSVAIGVTCQPFQMLDQILIQAVVSIHCHIGYH